MLRGLWSIFNICDGCHYFQVVLASVNRKILRKHPEDTTGLYPIAGFIGIKTGPKKMAADYRYKHVLTYDLRQEGHVET